jgi:hypothetical protein
VRQIPTAAILLTAFLLAACGSHKGPSEPEPCTGPGCTGDINHDGITFTIADAVMFTNYFVSGLDAFPEGFERVSAEASDMNGDGITLSVADLAFMERVLIGDANPENKPAVETVNTEYTYLHDVLSVRGEMRTAFLVFSGDVMVELLAENMELKYAFDGESTKALVFSLDGNTFDDEVVVGNGLISVEFGSAEGAVVNTRRLTGVVPE